MRRHYHWPGLAAFAASLAMCSASMAQAPTTQTPTAQTPATPVGASAAGRDHQPEPVIAAGCLQRGPSSDAHGGSAGGATASVAGTASAGPAAGGYVLRNARITGSSESTSGGPTSGRPESAAGAPSSSVGNARGNGPVARDLRLSAGTGVNLEEHVGHQVSVTGAFSRGSGTATSKPSVSGSHANQTPPATETQSSHERQAREQGRGAVGQAGRTLTVSSISMVATVCSAGS